MWSQPRQRSVNQHGMEREKARLNRKQNGMAINCSYWEGCVLFVESSGKVPTWTPVAKQFTEAGVLRTVLDCIF